MPYQTSQASRDIMAQLRNLLGGGGGGTASQIFGPSSQDLTANGLIPPQPQASSSNFLASILGQGPISGDLSNLSGQQQGQQQSQQQQTPQDFVEEFLKSMAGNLGAGGSGLNQADYEEALKNSAAQIKGAFGAEIGAVRASSAAARHQTKRSKKQIKAMYNALSRQYNKGAGAEVGQGKDIANALQQVANNAAGQVQGSSSDLLNQQAALAQGLGVQSALPTVAAQQSADTAKQVGNIEQYGAREAGDTLSNSGSQQRFLVRGGKNSLLEGTNRRADLVEQLQAFLQQNMGKIADIKGQRGQALAANQASVAKSFGDAANNAQDSSWQRQKELASLLLTLRGQNQKGSGGASSLLSKSDQLASQLLGGTSDPQGIGSVIQQLLTSPTVTSQSFGSGPNGNTPTQMNAGEFSAMLEAALKKAGYSDADIAAAKKAGILTYQGVY